MAPRHPQDTKPLFADHPPSATSSPGKSSRTSSTAVCGYIWLLSQGLRAEKSDRAPTEDLYYWSQMGSHEKWTAALVREMAQVSDASKADLMVMRCNLHARRVFLGSKLQRIASMIHNLRLARPSRPLLPRPHPCTLCSTTTTLFRYPSQRTGRTRRLHSPSTSG